MEERLKMKKLIIPSIMLILMSFSVLAASWSGASSSKVNIDFSLKISDAIVYKITIPSGCQATSLTDQLTGNILRASSDDTPTFKCTSIGDKVFTGEYSGGSGWVSIGSKTISITEEGEIGCTDTCSSLGYECGVWSICDLPKNCGSCASTELCSSGQCEPKGSCTETCQSKGYECGIWTICGEPTTCGSCTSSEQCSDGQCMVEEEGGSAFIDCDTGEIYHDGECITPIKETCPDGKAKQFWQNDDCSGLSTIAWVGIGAIAFFIFMSMIKK